MILIQDYVSEPLVLTSHADHIPDESDWFLNAGLSQSVSGILPAAESVQRRSYDLSWLHPTKEKAIYVVVLFLVFVFSSPSFPYPS